jgi:hypothetical protein
MSWDAIRLLPFVSVRGTLLLIDLFSTTFADSFSRRPITAFNVLMSSSVAVPAFSFDTSCAFMARSVSRSAMGAQMTSALSPCELALFRRFASAHHTKSQTNFTAEIHVPVLL